MVLARASYVLCVVVLINVNICYGDFVRNYPKPTTPLPFPTCKADNVDCLRRGLRTFFILMDSNYLGMKSIDPVILNSISIFYPDQQMSLLLRKVNVTGARWTKLLDRKFNLEHGKSGVIFSNDLHVTGEISMSVAGRPPYSAYITMDIYGAESNITYSWTGKRGTDNEDYIIINQERIAVRNLRLPTFFLQPNSESAYAITDILQQKTSIVDHFSNEITTVLMHAIVDNFRLFASKVPVKYFYEYYK